MHVHSKTVFFPILHNRSGTRLKWNVFFIAGLIDAAFSSIRNWINELLRLTWRNMQFARYSISITHLMCYQQRRYKGNHFAVYCVYNRLSLIRRIIYRNSFLKIQLLWVMRTQIHLSGVKCQVSTLSLLCYMCEQLNARTSYREIEEYHIAQHVPLNAVK